MPAGSTPEEHSLGPPDPSLNAEAYFHPWQSWSLAWGVTKVHTSPRSSTLTWDHQLWDPSVCWTGYQQDQHLDQVDQAEGSQGDQAPVWYCLYFLVLLNGPHLSKLVKLIVSRKRCLGAWWGRSCGILSKLLDKPYTAQLLVHYDIYIDFSSTNFQSHQNCMWDRWSLLQPWQVKDF